MPWESAFLAGKAFLDYRRNRGTRSSTLPDFFIGAHAAVAELKLLTRDATRYRTYFPAVQLTSPDKSWTFNGRISIPSYVQSSGLSSTI